MPTWIRQPSRKTVQGRTEYDPGAIKCSCGRTVELTQDWQGTACACGLEYGSEGQLFRKSAGALVPTRLEYPHVPGDDGYPSVSRRLPDAHATSDHADR